VVGSTQTDPITHPVASLAPRTGVDVTGWPDRLAVRSWTPADAQAVAHWRYSGKWSVYDQHDGNNVTGADATEAVGYRAVVAADDGTLVGFYCVGMAPAFVGAGRGNAFLQAVLDDVGQDLPAKPVRSLIQSWNVRSLSLARRLGFVETGTHWCVQDGNEIDYTIVVRPVRG
jgi:RimJ/RimL family protein N-acetyltransferase